MHVAPLPAAGRLLLLFAFLSIFATPAAATAEDFQSILRDYQQVEDAADPIGAGRRGDAEALRRWPDVTPAARAEVHGKLETLRRRIAAIDPSTLSGGEALDYQLLANRLELDTDAFAFDEARIPFISGDGFFTTPDYVAFATHPSTQVEAEAWLERLRGLGDFFSAHVANMRRGLETGFTQPRLTTRKAIESLRAQAEAPAAGSSLVAPMTRLPDSIPAARQQALRTEAIRLVDEVVRPAQRATLRFLEEVYLPRTRESVGIREVPGGEEYYRHLIRRHTTTRLGPQEIHQLGLEEIARIRAEMATVMAEAGFEGTLPEFLQMLRTDRQFYAPSIEAYVQVGAEIAKRIDMEVPRLIGHLPRLTFGLRRLPPEVGNSSAGYWPGDAEAGQAASILIHNERVLSFPLFQLAAWVAHEGVPGHHTQIALAQELEDVSEFRRGESITAFVEGWALYAETLAGEMGIYRTPYERFGKLSYEAWRASRLVVDTGIHAFGWSRQRAVDYLTANTALSALEINNEIDRYIAWPGQALAYKMGELTMVRLRREAEQALGPRFDVRRFHDAILSDGPMTLEMLEKKMAGWTRSEAARAP